MGLVREPPCPLWLVPAYLILFALLALWVSTTFRLHIEPGDEGVTLLGASRVATGEIPHEDFFEIIPPGSFLPVAGVFRILGASVEAGRAVAVLYAFLLVVVMEWVGRKIGVSPFSRLAVCALLVPFGVWTWPMASHHWLADLLILGSFGSLLVALGNGEVRGIGRCAVPCSAALAAWGWYTLQDQGGYWVLALGAMFIWGYFLEKALFRVLKRWFLWFAGFSGIALSPLLIVAGPQSLLYQWAIFPANRYHGIPGNEGIIGHGWSESWGALSTAIGLAQGSYAVAQLLFHGVLLIAPLTSGYLIWVALRYKGRRNGALLLVGAQAAFYGTCLHRWSALNMTWALPAGLLGLGLFLDGLDRSEKPQFRILGRVAGWGMLLIAAGSLISGIAVVQRSPRYSVVGPGGRLETLDPAQAMALNEVLTAVANRVPEGEAVFFSGYFPLLNVLSARPNPTRYNLFIVPEYHTPEQVQEVIRTLLAKREAWVVLPMPVRPESMFDQDVLRNFRRVWTGSRFAIFVREEAPVPEVPGKI